MLTVVRSPISRIPTEPGAGPAEAADLLAPAIQRPERCLWLVPEESRLGPTQSSWRSTVTPRFHTFREFVALALSYTLDQRRVFEAAERLPRLARAWQVETGHPAAAGLVQRLDRLVYDWQVCGVEPPSKTSDVAENVVARYLRELSADGLLDDAGCVRALCDAVADSDSPLHEAFLVRLDLLVFDGFHRLEPLEAHLLASLSHRYELLLWLVAAPGQTSWQSMELTLSVLERRRAQMRVAGFLPAPAPLAGVGRRLFPVAAESRTPLQESAGLYRLETAGPLEEVEQIARHIKADLTAGNLRPGDIAVVIPGGPYNTLVPEAFARSGLPFQLSGPGQRLSLSRPARLLASAWELFRSPWRSELLLDFLHQPIIKRHLQDANLLGHLFEQRPPVRREQSGQSWLDHWQQYVRGLERRIERLRSGEQQFEAAPGRSLEEYLQVQTAECASLGDLVASLRKVLQPVLALETALAAQDQSEQVLASFARACLEMLEASAMHEWLAAPPAGVSARECQRDQRAYVGLLEILRTLGRLPVNHVPQALEGRPDPVATLQLILETATTGAGDSTQNGIQVLEPHEVAGLRFQHIYAIGLSAELAPALSEQGAFAATRRRNPILHSQVQQKETEVAFHFSQLFESAQDRLVLSRPLTLRGQPAEPNPVFLLARANASPPELPPILLATSAAEAAIELGRAARGRRTAELPFFAHAPGPRLQSLYKLVRAWQARPGWPRSAGVDSDVLLQLHFDPTRAFSASDLETYAACPFRYFALQLLKLREEGADQTRIHYGSLVHKVLQLFYVELREQFAGAADQPLPPVSDEHREVLLRLFEREWQQLGDGVLPPDLKKMFATEQGVLQLFLDTMKHVEAQYGNIWNEYDLTQATGQPVLLGHDARGQPVHVTGRVDRIDIHRANGAQAIIIDYKSGRNQTARQRREKMDDGRMLQLPLYASALAEVHKDLQVIGGAYIYLGERVAQAETALGIAGDWTQPGNKPCGIPFDPAAARRKAIELAEKMRAGRFPLTQHAEECTSFCPLRHACRQPDGVQGTWR